jgi:periplasmic protein TonB
LPSIVIEQFTPSAVQRRSACRRLTVATLLAAVIWSLFLSHAQWLLIGERASDRPSPPLDVRLVELPQPQPDSPRLAAPEQPQTEKMKREPADVAPHPVRTVRPVHQRSTSVAQRSEPVPTQALPPDSPARSRSPISASAEPTSQPAPRATAQTAPPANARSVADNPPMATAEPSAASRSNTPSNGPARIVDQPLPELPDDLREEGYQFVAVARFLVHANGSFDVELIKPTPIPRLNQILIATLHRWRFVPATESGRPIESQQDVRVHFNVD